MPFCSIYLVRISNADITLRCDATVDDLIDVVEGNRRVSLSKFLTFFCENLMLIYPSYRNYIPCIYLLNKIDQISIEELEIITKVYNIKITFASPIRSLSSPFYHRPVF